MMNFPTEIGHGSISSGHDEARACWRNCTSEIGAPV